MFANETMAYNSQLLADTNSRDAIASKNGLFLELALPTTNLALVNVCLIFFFSLLHPHFKFQCFIGFAILDI